MENQRGGWLVALGDHIATARFVAVYLKKIKKNKSFYFFIFFTYTAKRLVVAMWSPGLLFDRLAIKWRRKALSPIR